MSAGHGSASRHWRNQRLTSVALLPLGLWFLFSLLRQPSLDHAVVAGWFAMPLQALLAALFGAALLWHSAQGLQVVLEDYVRGVVANELSPGGFPAIEALKAQAIAARTYALKNRGQFMAWRTAL